MTRTKTAKLWAERMQRFQQAEMTIAQFCVAEGVSQPSFYNWRRKLQSPPKSVSDTVAKFIPVALPSSPDQARLPTDRTSTTIELPGGIRICVEVPMKSAENRSSQAWP